MPELFHISPRPDGVHWDAVQYWDPARRQGVVYAFRGSVPDEVQHRFALKGLRGPERYLIHFRDGSAPDQEATGNDLMQQGILVHLLPPA